MPAIQSTYAAQHARWVEGLVLTTEPNVIVTRIAEDAEGVGFGKVCVQGDADNTITDSEPSKKFEGIAVLDATQPNGTYERYASVAVLKKGVVAVQASVAVAKGDAVYFVPATGVLTNVSTNNTLIPNAQWDTSTSGAGLAALRLA
ncbi:hypothetical protein AEAC466_13425 [Asticcacaulis sp. AC466]|uniref:structural cement protein Gp24 n=1 Tax=Asticcacaulis sp. AC466 TaxID=1282362 RepID=UPI0003C3E5E7|nr:DUF2190 family protein [Asticcacaulis sp. AC466]ESQ83247.1 hypothetical protein AEAC466_13425 [Asticcacaulis sp. AC466]